jgi:hypothetical protein
MSCDHECTSNCRRNGCNCECGEFHVSGTIDDLTEREVEEYNQRVYGGAMPAHNKAVLRSVIKKEDEFWAKESVRQDNHTGRDDQ